MGNEARSTGLGMIAGIYANVVTGDFTTTVVMAFLCGGAAYLGQLIIKEIHIYIKKKTK